MNKGTGNSVYTTASKNFTDAAYYHFPVRLFGTLLLDIELYRQLKDIYIHIYIKYQNSISCINRVTIDPRTKLTRITLQYQLVCVYSDESKKPGYH